jgi:endonuclease YncB( thermonuclease family)
MNPMKYLFVLALLLGLTCHAGTIEGRVVRVADGNTITVLDARKVQHKIRLAGTDAPEKFQAFGQRSKDSLSALVFRLEVTVQTRKRDKYGPEVGKVLVGGLDANLEQVRRGFAWHYNAHEQSAEDRRAYAAAEAEARLQRVGLWRDAHPVPPWEFRKGKRKK